MRTPGFTAEAALSQRRGHYRQITALGSSGALGGASGTVGVAGWGEDVACLQLRGTKKTVTGPCNHGAGTHVSDPYGHLQGCTWWFSYPYIDYCAAGSDSFVMSQGCNPCLW
jgi:hypothetical protein